MSGSPWDRRIARAAELEEACPAAAELMRLYRQMAELAARSDVRAARRAGRTEPHEIEPLLQLLARAAPPPMAQAAEALLREPTHGQAARWQAVIESPSTPAEEFIS